MRHTTGWGLASVTYPSGTTLVTCYGEQGRAIWVSGACTVNDCITGAIAERQGPRLCAFSFHRL